MASNPDQKNFSEEKRGIGQRIATLRDWCRLTQAELARKLEISRSGLSQIESGAIAASLDVIYSVFSKFDIHMEWLMNGTGMIFQYTDREVLKRQGKLGAYDADMGVEEEAVFPVDYNGILANIEKLPEPERSEMKQEINRRINEVEKRGSVDGSVNGSVTPANKTKGTKKEESTSSLPFSRGPQVLVVTTDNSGQENIAFVNTEAAAGYPERFLEPEYYSTLPTFSLPGNMFRNATFRCFQVAGNSMSPSFEQNDWVIASYVDNWPSNLKTNFVYVIVTTTNVLVKRVMNRLEQRNRLVLLSDNEDHDPIEIDQEEVRELWYVRARLSFRFPNIRFNTQQKVRDLEVDFFNLREEFQQLRQQALIKGPLSHL